MSTEVTSGLAKLREPFPPECIGKLPKGGAQLDFVGHAHVTDRLLTVDPMWSWEPFATDEHGLPAVSREGDDLVLWIRLTVCGVTRPGVGTAAVRKGGDALKELVSDALRNAAMRFGVALDLWAKEDLESHRDPDAPRKSAPAKKAAPSAPPKPKLAADVQSLVDRINALPDDVRKPCKSAVSLLAGSNNPAEWKNLTEVTKAVDEYEAMAKDAAA